MGSRALILVRHAKAGDGATDRERPLTARGERDARSLGSRLHPGGVPDLVLCSTALRTRTTWALVEEGLGKPATVRYEDSLYAASADEMLGLVQETDDAVRRLVVVGHNPGTHELAMRLAGARTQLAGFPTCAAAMLSVQGTWHGVADRDAELVDVLLPGS